MGYLDGWRRGRGASKERLRYMNWVVDPLREKSVRNILCHLGPTNGYILHLRQLLQFGLETQLVHLCNEFWCDASRLTRDNGCTSDLPLRRVPVSGITIPRRGGAKVWTCLWFSIRLSLWRSSSR